MTLLDGYVILEPNVGGHRLAYVSLLSGSGLEVRARWLTVVGAPGSAEAKEHLDPSVLTTAVTRPPGSRWVAAASRVARKEGVIHIVIPDGDVRLLGLLWALPRLVLRRQTVSILIMRTGISTARGSVLRLLVKRAVVRFLCLAPGISVFQLTDCFGVGRGIRRFRKASPLCDPIPAQEKGINPVSHLMAQNLAWIGVCGAIDPRKNVSLAIEAVAQSENVGLVLAGRISAEVEASLAKDPAAMKLLSEGRLLICNRLLSDAELDGVLTDLSAILILHENDSPSGIMGRAAAVGTAAIVPVGGWLARIVGATGGGCSTELTKDALSSAILKVLSDLTIVSGAAKRAMDGHSPGQFPDALIGQS